jgi:hypothetical protein
MSWLMLLSIRDGIHFGEREDEDEDEDEDEAKRAKELGLTSGAKLVKLDADSRMVVSIWGTLEGVWLQYD